MTLNWPPGKMREVAPTVEGLGACSTPAENTPGRPPERTPAKLLRSVPGATPGWNPSRCP
jgi:hypothetical protein